MWFGVGDLDWRKRLSTQSPPPFSGSFVSASVSYLVSVVCRNLRPSLGGKLSYKVKTDFRVGQKSTPAQIKAAKKYFGATA